MNKAESLREMRRGFAAWVCLLFAFFLMVTISWAAHEYHRMESTGNIAVGLTIGCSVFTPVVVFNLWRYRGAKKELELE